MNKQLSTDPSPPPFHLPQAILTERRARRGPASPAVAAAWPFTAATGPIGVHEQSCAIAIDTKGPEIRTGFLKVCLGGGTVIEGQPEVKGP